jgi:uncharacterized protein (TIGR02452 family)
MNLINVFQDTLEISKNLPNRSQTTRHTTQEIIGPYLSEFENNIIVEPLDTVSAIQKWSKVGRVCALNMASYKRPGGGVENGARAQEECLFRCSNLFDVVSKDLYPLRDHECLYTQRALFFKDKDYYQITPIQCDVITIAALRLSGVVSSSGLVGFEPESGNTNYEETTREKIRLMLSVPQSWGAQYLILGAWGCGVFKNDPEKIAQYFKDSIIGEGYGSLYKKIIFAVINDHNSVANNYEIFNTILNTTT